MRNFLKSKKAIAIATFMFFLAKGIVWLGLVYFGYALMDFSDLS